MFSKWYILFFVLLTFFNLTNAQQNILINETFDDEQLVNRGWYDGESWRINKDSFRGAGCIEYEWIKGIQTVQGTSVIRHHILEVEGVYIRFYLRLSKDWQWTGVNWHPHLTHFMTTENSEFHGPAASHLTLYVEPVNGKLRLAATDIQNEKMPHGLLQGPLKGGYNGILYDSKEKLFIDDKWHCIEACFRLNTLDVNSDKPNRDGIVRGWFDGKLVIDNSDVILRSTDFPDMKINQFLIAPYFGPGLLNNSQKLWIDELVVSTRRIGPLPAHENQSGIFFCTDSSCMLIPTLEHLNQEKRHSRRE